MMTPEKMIILKKDWEDDHPEGRRDPFVGTFFHVYFMAVFFFKVSSLLWTRWVAGPFILESLIILLRIFNTMDNIILMFRDAVREMSHSCHSIVCSLTSTTILLSFWPELLSVLIKSEQLPEWDFDLVIIFLFVFSEADWSISRFLWETHTHSWEVLLLVKKRTLRHRLSSPQSSPRITILVHVCVDLLVFFLSSRVSIEDTSLVLKSSWHQSSLRRQSQFLWMSLYYSIGERKLS